MTSGPLGNMNELFDHKGVASNTRGLNGYLVICRPSEHTTQTTTTQKNKTIHNPLQQKP